MGALQKMSRVLPYKITKRINKTGEARSGAEIYKRRNSRSYRGLMQYTTWNKLKTGVIIPNILPEYSKGCLVWLSPREYFGNNYPNKADDLNENFVLGVTGFIYYTNIDEYNTYPPLTNWKELYELSTQGKNENDDTWIGDYCLNVKNSNPKKVSEICKDKEAKKSFDELKIILNDYGIEIDEDTFPSQCGIGNYDYDYASDVMIENVKLQMLYMILCCEDSDGHQFRNYIKSNIDDIIDSKHDTAAFKTNITKDNYDELYDEFVQELKEECEAKGLLNFERLKRVNAWSIERNRPICPLCSKNLESKNFFEEILQAEGRRVQDNTQREIVLMHINALRSGKLNHRVYNLGWGHNFCNAIQGDKDIDETINELRDLVATYDENTR